MAKPRVLRILPALVLTLVSLACEGSNEVSGSSTGGVVRVAISAPGTVRLGEAFQLRFELENGGATTIRNATVELTLDGVTTDNEAFEAMEGSLSRSVLRSSTGFLWRVGDFGPNARPHLSFFGAAQAPGRATVSVEATVVGRSYGGADVIARKEIAVNQ